MANNVTFLKNQPVLMDKPLFYLSLMSRFLKWCLYLVRFQSLLQVCSLIWQVQFKMIVKILTQTLDIFFNLNACLVKNKFLPGWIIDSGANQHMNGTSDYLVDVVDFKFSVGHPNGTHTFIKQIGNMRINNCVTLFDVLVIPMNTM